MASVVLLTFAWLLVYPTVLAAQTPPHPPPAQFPTSGAEAELAETLATIEATLTRLQARLAQGQASGPEDQALAHLRQRLTQVDQRVHAHFEQIAQHLQNKGLPREIQQRHEAIVTTYVQELAALLNHLDAIEATKDQTTRQEKVEQALTRLKIRQKRRLHQPLQPNKLPNLPSLSDPARRPKTTQDQFTHTGFLSNPYLTVAVHGSFNVGQLPGANDPAYVAATDEVVLTQVIRDQATALQHNPIQIYNWVRNNIAGYNGFCGSCSTPFIEPETSKFSSQLSA